MTEEVKPNPYASYTPDQLIDMYTKLRDGVRMAEERHKKKVKPAQDEMENIETEMLARLNSMKVDSVKCTHGTMYRSHRKSATLADPAAFKDFVIQNKKWELADWRANAVAVADFIQENVGATPPGVNYTVHWTVGVRKGKGDASS